MDPVLTPIFTALLSALAAFGGGFLAHYATDQRERLARQAAFRDQQLKQLYGPVLARLMELVQHWNLVRDLTANRQQLIDQHHLQGEQLLATIKPAQDYHALTHQFQNQVFKEILTITKENFHLAEESTRLSFGNLCRYIANREAVGQVHVPIDATGTEIPSPESPYPQVIRQFILNIETEYNRVAGELRNARYSELAQPTNILIQTPTLPLLPGPNQQPPAQQ